MNSGYEKRHMSCCGKERYVETGTLINDSDSSWGRKGPFNLDRGKVSEEVLALDRPEWQFI